MWFAALLAASGVLLAQIEDQPQRDDTQPLPPAPVLTRAPELLEPAEPVFPEDAQKEGITGDVILVITISETGDVTEAVVSTALDPRLDAAALEAAGKLKFRPAEFDDVPAPVKIEFEFSFTLSVPAPPVPDPDAAAPPTPVSLTGRALVRGRRTPIAGAIVVSGEVSTSSDDEGHFELRLPPGDAHEVTVKFPGFHSFETTESVVEGKVTEVTYYLLKKSSSPYETVVRAPRPKKEVSQVTLTREELTRVPGTFGDPLRVLENLPGMQRSSFLGGELLVRGANAEDSGVYFDGVDIPLLYHFGGLTSVVNAEFLDQINFQPGGFGARYGRAIAGVVDVSSRRLTGKLRRGSVKIDLMDTALFYRQPITDTVAMAVAVRRSYVDVILPLVLNATGQDGLTLSPQYTDYQLKVDWDVDRNHDLTFFGFGSNDTFKIVTPSSERANSFNFRLVLGFHRVMASHVWRIGPKLKLRQQPFVGLTIQGAGGGESGGDLNFSFKLTRYEGGLREDLTWEQSDQLTLRAGLDLFLVRAVALLDVPFGSDLFAFPAPTQVLAENQELRILSGGSGNGIWTEATWQPVEGLKITPGLRFEFYVFNEFAHPVIEPRLAVRYRLLEKTTLKAAYGLYRQPPDVFVINPVIGNPALRPEAAQHFVLGGEQILTEFIDLDLQAFYNLRFNLTVPSAEMVIRDGEEVAERFNNEGIGRAYGLEMLLRHKFSERFFGWIAYTLMRSEFLDHPGDDYTRTDTDQTHILTVVGSYRFGFGLEFGLRFRLVTGNPYTPVVSASHNLDADNFNPVRAAVNSDRLPTFHQLDLRVEYTAVYNTFTISYFLDLLNAYNQKNVEDFQYDYRYQGRNDFNGLPLFPVLGVKGEF